MELYMIECTKTYIKRFSWRTDEYSDYGTLFHDACTGTPEGVKTLVYTSVKGSPITSYPWNVSTIDAVKMEDGFMICEEKDTDKLLGEGMGKIKARRCLYYRYYLRKMIYVGKKDLDNMLKSVYVAAPHYLAWTTDKNDFVAYHESFARNEGAFLEENNKITIIHKDGSRGYQEVMEIPVV